ncbi:MAG: DUF6614 family protein [Chloroflexota bacterium]
MIKMHGFFDLKEGQAESDFAAAYDRFAADLMEQKLIVTSRSMRRRPDPNYDSSPPETKYYISMDFVDMAQAQACWDYIENGASQDTKLHRNVYGRIKDYAFFLSEDLDSGENGA